MLTLTRTVNYVVLQREGCRIGKLTISFVLKKEPLPIPKKAIWAACYDPLFSFIEDNPDVMRAVAYINTHWDSQSRWFCIKGHSAGTQECPEGNWGDTRIQANEYIKKKWLEQVQNKDV